MVTELLFSIAILACGFAAGRVSKTHDCSPAWVDGWSAGYLAAMDDQDAVQVHREGDRHED